MTRLLLVLLGLASLVAIAVAGLRSATSRRQPMPTAAVTTWRVPNPYRPDTASGIDAVDVTFVAYGVSKDEPGGGW